MSNNVWEWLNSYPSVDSLKKLKIIAPKYFSINGSCKYIHITGTNGKGSVSRMVYAVLTNQLAENIALFTSPHITVFNERIIVNNKMISDEEFLLIKNLIVEDVNKYELGFFAILTLIAFIYFQNQKVTWAVIEVGFGGTYDTTNIITAFYAVITSISKDHDEILGQSLAAILEQKLGIVKPETKKLFVSGNLKKPLKAIIEKKYQPIYADHLVNKPYYEENKSLALKIIAQGFPNINLVTAKKIIENTNIKLRFEKKIINDKIIYFDVAHNIGGIKALIRTLKIHQVQPDVIIFSCLQKKHPQTLIKILRLFCNNVIICQNSHSQTITGAEFNYQKMIKNSDNKTILITGSCYFLADVYNSMY